MSTEEEKINILPTFRRALSALSMLELSNVQADLTICLQTAPEKLSFYITVFNSPSGNTTFFFGSHELQERADARLRIAIDAIKTDDIDQIKKISKEVQT